MRASPNLSFLIREMGYQYLHRLLCGLKDMYEARGKGLVQVSPPPSFKWQTLEYSFSAFILELSGCSCFSSYPSPAPPHLLFLLEETFSFA